ncbi:hypothetical protein [Frondihabitans sucicola]|uniref:hypothetical protein n=1 Tax=Frondihabitans sucicola TaxID=1268041 RepID=UPI002573F91B|nr:hypothetical protein [Frondihabitans sucicola]
MVEIGGIRVTSLARTGADIALSAPRADAVTILDCILARCGGDSSAVAASLGERPRARAAKAAARALAFASPQSQSPGESFARVVLDEIGAPEPVLQRPFFDERGAIGEVDFWFDAQGAMLEFDGVVKYTEARYLGRLTPAEVVVREKRREDRIRRRPEVRGFTRCDWRDLHEPRRLAKLLGGVGVPLLRPP